MNETATELPDKTRAEQPSTADDGWEWCFLEIMGHRSHWGRTRQEERFGAKMIRIDVPNNGDPAAHGWTTHYYGGASIFSYSLTDEATVMKRNKPYEPPSRLQIPWEGHDYDHDSEDDDEEGDDAPAEQDGEFADAKG